MNAPYVCSRCYRQITRCSYQRRQTSFVSFEKRRLDTSDSNPKATRIPEEDANTIFTKPVASRKQPLPENKGLSSLCLPQAQHLPSRAQIEADRILESLFNSNRRSKPYIRSSLGIPDTLTPHTKTKNSLVTPAEACAQLRARCRTQKVPINDIWKDLEQIVNQYPFRDVVSSNLVPDILVEAVRRRWDASARSLPPLLEIVRRYGAYLQWKRHWDHILWAQLAQLVNDLFNIKQKRVYDQHRISAGKQLREVLDVWRFYLGKFADPARSKGNAQPSSDTSATVWLQSYDLGTDWLGLLREDDPLWTQALEDNKIPLSRRTTLVRDYRTKTPKAARANLAAASLTRQCVQLIRSQASPERHVIDRDKYRPFLGFLDRILEGCEIDAQEILTRLSMEGVPREASSKIVDRMVQSDNSMSKTSLDPPIENFPQLASAGSRSSEAVALGQDEYPSIFRQLKSAVQRSNPKVAKDLWHDIQSRFNQALIATGLYDDVFTQFLSGFFALRSSEQAVEVWNVLIRSGVQPNQKHWHSMLVGCCRGKDFDSLKGVWSNMQSAQVVPDNALWTEWIRGLILCRAWDSAIEQLKILGTIWQQCANSREGNDSLQSSRIGGGQLRASLDPIRAAISASLATDRPDLAQGVLGWALSQGLKPDTQTYNILLRPAVRQADDKAVDGILSQMAKHNCDPDVATLTIVIGGVLSSSASSFRSLSPTEQQAKASALLNSMMAGNLEATTHTYSTLLASLLGVSRKPGPSNLPAARAVLAHMSQNNISASPHIYTILVTHYFSLSPPDLPALESLWKQIVHTKGVVDRIFYDRMIEGYARCLEIEKTLYFLRKMPHQGMSPGWGALLETLRALVAKEEWELAEELVKDVEEGEWSQWGNGPIKEKAEFVGMVDGLREEGLLKEKTMKKGQ